MRGIYGGTGYMSSIKDKYVNPFTDFGFKRIFGSEENKDMLVDFLNTLLQEEEHKVEYIEEIEDVALLDKEQLGAPWDRPAVFDIYCRTPNGERFVVEMQQGKQSYFRDRMLYYATYAIRAQSKRQNWNFKLEPVYMVGLLNFNLDNGKEFHHVERIRQDGDFKVTNKNLTFIYIEMKKFQKKIEEIEGKYENWLFALNNMPDLPDIPEKLHSEPFERLFDVASIINFTEDECAEYEKAVDDLRNNLATLECAQEESRAAGLAEGREIGRSEGKAEGVEEGLKEGRVEGAQRKAVEIARNLLAQGLSPDMVSQATGVSVEDLWAPSE